MAAPHTSFGLQAEEALPSEQKLPGYHLAITSSESYVTEGAHAKVIFIMFLNSTCQY